ncbi:helix-turn-helix domain-containing protein [Amorphus coralli]|uniref:helix-turn-helix domain-containing protein n=1 Tax=Amorphus coralli TaxID=340680 RepID=UPI0003675256|nr:XRE family transcriptional regulator [Amorphus coralli]
MSNDANWTRSDPALAEDLKTGSLAPSNEKRPLERVLGAHVRRLRRQQDLSIGDLAQAAGISSGMLSKFENGQISPSLTKLQAIAGALGLQMSSLLAESEERRDCSYVQNGQGVIIDRRGTKVGHIYRLLGHGLRADVIVEPYLIELHEDAIPYPHFKHAGSEFIYMLSGCVAYRHGEQIYELRAGDAILFDSFAHHGPEALIELPATYLSVIIYNRDQA